MGKEVDILSHQLVRAIASEKTSARFVGERAVACPID
jgi:hypothetical protein